MDNVKVYEKHIKLLGYKARDKVTGFEGIITSVSFELYGCIQIILTPQAKNNNKVEHGDWFDVTRLKIQSKNPVMDLPAFTSGYIAEGKKGAAKKPVRSGF